MKLFSIITFLFLSSTFLNAQNFVRLKLYNDSTVIKKMLVDENKNVYVAGYFGGTNDFDAGSSVSNVSSNGMDDIFLMKMDKDGHFLWVKNFGGVSFDRISSMALDHFGHIILCGSFGSTVDFDPSPTTYNLTSVSGNDGFISRFDTSGNFIWAKQVSAFITSTAVGSSGEIYSCGGFSTSVDFDPNAGVFSIATVDSTDAFVWKLDSAGQFVWAKNFGGIHNEICNSIAIDTFGNILTTGSFFGSVDFDPGVGVMNLTSSGSSDIFVSKLNSAGDLVWANRMGGTNQDQGISIVVDTFGNVYSSGNYRYNADFNPGPLFNNLNSVSGSRDIYLSKLDSSGNYVWAKSIGGAGSEIPQELRLNSSGFLCLVGTFQLTCDFDPGTGVHNRIASGDDIFYAKYTTQGIINSTLSFGFIFDDITYTSATDDDFIYLSGVAFGAVDFDPGAGQQTPLPLDNKAFILKLGPCQNYTYMAYVTKCDSYVFNGITYTASGSYLQEYISSEGCDSFINLALTIHHPSSSSITVSACNSYSVGSYLHTSSGTYSDTISNSFGCDSIVTLNLTIQNIDTSVTRTGNTLHANLSGATYQWINCASNSIISGATNQDFTPTVNSSFAVIVSQGGCTDTSNCYFVSTLGLNDHSSLISLNVSPNPATDFIKLSTTIPLNHASIQFRDLTGQILQEKTNIIGNDVMIPISNFAPSIYILNVEEDGSIKQFKVIKK